MKKSAKNIPRVQRRSVERFLAPLFCSSANGRSIRWWKRDSKDYTSKALPGLPPRTASTAWAQQCSPPAKPSARGQRLTAALWGSQGSSSPAGAAGSAQGTPSPAASCPSEWGCQRLLLQLTQTSPHSRNKGLLIFRGYHGNLAVRCNGWASTNWEINCHLSTAPCSVPRSSFSISPWFSACLRGSLRFRGHLQMLLFLKEHWRDTFL